MLSNPGQTIATRQEGAAGKRVVPHQPASSKRKFMSVADAAQLFESVPVVDTTAWHRDLAGADDSFADDVIDPFARRSR